MLRAVGTWLAACCLSACATLSRGPQKLPDGSFRASCEVSLSTCLEAFDRLCEWHGYDVISASESRRRSDLRDVPSVQITSEAVVRCKLGEPLFGSWPQPTPATPPAPTPTPPPAPTVPPPSPPSQPMPPA